MCKQPFSRIASLIAAATGNFIMFPSTYWDEFTYDPRRRPWYTAAQSGPKDIVVILDITKLGHFGFVRDLLEEFLGRLSGEDYVNVIAHSNTALQSACFGGHLARATPGNIAEIRKFIDELGVLVVSDLSEAFLDSLNLLEATREASTDTTLRRNDNSNPNLHPITPQRDSGSLCEANIVIISDRDDISDNELAIMKNKVAKAADDRIDETVIGDNIADKNGIHVFTVHVTSDEDETSVDAFLEKIKCISTGVSMKVNPDHAEQAVAMGDIEHVLFAIFDYWSDGLGGAEQGVFWSQPYGGE